METIIGRFLTPLNSLRTMRERPSRRDDNSRGRVQNVRGDSSAVPRQNWRREVVDHYRERVPINRRATPPKRPARMRDEHDSLEPTRDTHERAAPYKHVDGVNTATCLSRGASFAAMM